MTEDEEIKKYISNINKIISSGDPKYISYISKEYMNYKKNNPILASVMENMIRSEASEKGSVYAIFVDNDNSMNLDAMSDISKITNVADFIKNVDALSEQDVDFGDLTSDELIIEGMQIAEDLAREIEELESTRDYEEPLEETNIDSQVESKASIALAKVSAFTAVSAGIKTAIDFIKNRIESAKNRVKENLKNKKIQKEQEKKHGNNEEVSSKNNHFIPKAIVSEAIAISNMKNNREKEQERKNSKITNISNDAFSGDADSSSTQEDDEPDI